jgi:serine/threonine protein kinase
MGTLNDWEKVRTEPLGTGGQSTVFLVRRPERAAAREKSLGMLRALSSQSFNSERALEFSRAALDVARQEHASELGALKMFRPRGAGQEAEQQALARMRNEIAILKQNRPGLLKLLDHNESDAWIVTEYCSKGTLDRHLDRYKGNAKLAIASFLSLLRTVLELHKEQVVHRDIKPQNIFLGESDELVLGDFGLVFLPNQPERLSFTGESVGPRDFMPPWVLLDEHPSIKPTFDVYMLGRVLWCMVTGRLKLHREDFLDPRLNVTMLFPDDPDMHIVNKILAKCVVTREEDCLSSSQDLLLMAGAYSEMMQRGGQLLDDGVPQHCHVCGVGQYRPESLGYNDSEGALRFWVSGNETVRLSVRPMVCDKCGHVELFKAH